jgi:4-amino-4-deoxy-L-arabinose transferase-like glycosyltransferase
MRRSISDIFENWRRLLFIVFFLALSVRGVFVLTQQDGFYFPDSLSYSRVADNLIIHGEFGATFGRAPGYPVFLALTYKVFGHSILAVRLVESFMGAILALILAVLGNRIGGKIVGGLAGFIWAVYPMAVFIAGLVYPTGLATMLLACGVGCILIAPDEELSAKASFWAGVFFGLSALTIPVSLLTIIISAAWIFYWARHSRLLLGSLFLCGAILALFPWTARNFAIHGKIVPVQANVYRHVPALERSKNRGERVDKITAMARHLDLFAKHFARQFMGFWELYPTNIRMMEPAQQKKWHERDPRIVVRALGTMKGLTRLVSVMTAGPILFFAVLGSIGMALRRELWPQLTLLWAVILSYAFGYALFVGRIRYRIPVEPYLIILSAYGAAQTFAVARKRMQRFAGNKSLPQEATH